MSSDSIYRFKHPCLPIDMGDNRIWVGGPMYRLGVEIKDPHGSFRQIAALLDGSRTVDDARDAFVEADGQGAEKVFERTLGLMWERGWLDRLDNEPNVSDEDRATFKRNLDYFMWVDRTPRESPWAAQESLAEQRVVVLGVGGVGSAAAQSIAGLGVGELVLIDGDNVEASNLNRQLMYSRADIGRPKAEAARDYINARFPRCSVTPVVEFPRTADRIAELAQGSSLLIHAADQPATLHEESNRAAFELGIPIVLSSYAGALLAASVAVPGCTPCISCISASGQLFNEQQGLGMLRKVERPDDFNPVIAPTAAMTGNFAALQAANLMVIGRSFIEGSRYQQSYLDPSAAFLVPGAHQPECRLCR